MSNFLVLTEKYATDILKNQLPANRVYHNYQHTFNVVSGANIIGVENNLPAEEQEIVLIAAWFHDTGHCQTFEGHEDVSKQIAEEFLKGENYPTDKIQNVLSCINATKMPQKPQSLIEQIICDSDLYHLSTSEYEEDAELLREEWHKVLGKSYNDKEWLEQNINFFIHHQYHSPFGKNVLEPQKQKNIQTMKAKLLAMQI